MQIKTQITLPRPGYQLNLHKLWAIPHQQTLTILYHLAACKTAHDEKNLKHQLTMDLGFEVKTIKRYIINPNTTASLGLDHQKGRGILFIQSEKDIPAAEKPKKGCIYSHQPMLAQQPISYQPASRVSRSQSLACPPQNSEGACFKFFKAAALTAIATAITATAITLV